MYGVADARAIQRMSPAQRGVFSTTDLKVVLAERHSAAFGRRIEALIENEVLRRFIRGWYVSEDFDLPTLSQRIGPGTCISFGAVLARALLIGTKPERGLLATKVGPRRTYSGLGYEIVHLSIAAHLDFGWTTTDGIRWANPEKAALDALYFHLRGRRYVFDLYSDVQYERLDQERLGRYLARYRNPRFTRFARNVLGMP